MNLSIVNNDLQRIKSRWLIAANFNSKKENMELLLLQDDENEVAFNKRENISVDKMSKNLHSLSGIKKSLLANR